MSVVIRSFQLTQKKVTLQFKALDGVIRYAADRRLYPTGKTRVLLGTRYLLCGKGWYGVVQSKRYNSSR